LLQKEPAHCDVQYSMSFLQQRFGYVLIQSLYVTLARKACFHLHSRFDMDKPVMSLWSHISRFVFDNCECKDIELRPNFT